MASSVGSMPIHGAASQRREHGMTSREVTVRNDEDTILNFVPPSKKTFARMLAPFKFYFSPVVSGLDHIKPGKPVLFVGNHTLYGVADWPLIINEIYQQREVFVRSLGDRMHYRVPVWRDYVSLFGVVEGTRENCSLLMENRDHVMVYPGGAREICKRKDEKYTLTWKKRTGFVSMAIQYGYPIMPFASVGPEDAWDIWVDADDIENSPISNLLDITGLSKGLLRENDLIPPISRGLGLTAIPRPEKFYFSFGKPIATKHFDGQHDDPELLMDLRGKVASSIKRQIKALQRKRANDTDVGYVRWLLQKL